MKRRFVYSLFLFRHKTWRTISYPIRYSLPKEVLWPWQSSQYRGIVLIAIVQKKASNATSIQYSDRIWTTYNQSALHSLGGSETPQSWPAKCIHGRLGAYLAKHWEDILCVLESPATGGIGKLMNQVAKIQSLTIWSCFLSSFLKLSKILNLFNISTSKSLLSHHWIDGLSRSHKVNPEGSLGSLQPRWIFRSILASDSNLWLLSFDLEIWKMFERPCITMEKKIMKQTKC